MQRKPPAAAHGERLQAARDDRIVVAQGVVHPEDAALAVPVRPFGVGKAVARQRPRVAVEKIGADGGAHFVGVAVDVVIEDGIVVLGGKHAQAVSVGGEGDCKHALGEHVVARDRGGFFREPFHVVFNRIGRNDRPADGERGSDAGSGQLEGNEGYGRQRARRGDGAAKQ